jgi:hypothetical protein
LAIRSELGIEYDSNPGRTETLLGDAAGAAAAAQKAVALLPLAAPGKPRSQQRINMEAALQRYRAKARP